MNQTNHNSNLISKRKIAGSYLLAILSFMILVVIDQLSKYYITTTMKLHDSQGRGVVVQGMWDQGQEPSPSHQAIPKPTLSP